MAAVQDTRCPICLDSWVNVSYVIPCLHQFCFRCIQQWAERKPECPLCKGKVSSIVYLVWADNSFEVLVMPPPVEAPVIIHLRGRALSHHHPAASQPQAVRLLPRAPLQGFQPHTWAFLFREHPALYQPLLPWLCQELGQMFGANHWEASVVEILVVSNLSLFGLDEETLKQLLQSSLQRHTAGFVYQLIVIAVEWCNKGAHRLLDTHVVEGEPHVAASPEGIPAPSGAIQQL